MATTIGLSKRQLVAEVNNGLRSYGYASVSGPVPRGAAALFYKRHDELVLTLGLELSGLYEERFTGSFYLSRSFMWAYVPRDLPRPAYQRIGHFLDQEDRHRLLQAEFSEAGVLDAWWIGFSNSSVSAFVEAVRLAEPRFLGQKGLVESVVQCDGLLRHATLVKETTSEVVRLSDRPEDLKHQPDRYSTAVPERWYWAAELVLVRRRPDSANPKSVDRLAVDAWRVATLP